MNSTTSRFVPVVALLASSLLASTAEAQEVALVYASNHATAHAMTELNSALTARSLAKAFAEELAAEMNVRLPKEQAKNAESLRLRDDFAQSIRSELDVRLREELNLMTALVRD